MEIGEKLLDRGELKLDYIHQKVNEQTTIKNTRFSVNAEGMTYVGKKSIFGATTPVVGAVIGLKDGQSFARKRTRGIEKTFVVPVASRKRYF